MKPNVHYRTNYSPGLVPISHQTNQANNMISYFYKINFNIIFTSTPTHSKCTIPFTFSTNSVYTSHHYHECNWPRLLIFLYLFILVMCGEEFKLWNFSLSNVLRIFATSSLFRPKYSPQHRGTKSQTPQCVSPNYYNDHFLFLRHCIKWMRYIALNETWPTMI
jgi:hypothetical protein